MTPAQLDIVLNGAFIYERADGVRYASFDYKLQYLGVPLKGRTGPMTPDDLDSAPADLLSRLTQRLAA